jgi:hypothetical protein
MTVSDPAPAPTEPALDTLPPPPQDRQSGLPSRGQALSAAIFFASGASLVVHILTDALLPAVFGALLVGGAVLLVQATSDPAVRARVVPLLRAGAIGGLVSTAVYDVARFALMATFDLHIKPFKALPYFGHALIGVEPHSTASWVAGVAFHITNGVCFGIGYTVLAGRRNLLWAVGFGLGLEAFMLTLYPDWLQIEAMKEFTQMSVFGHVAYGLSLGLVTNALLRDSPEHPERLVHAGPPERLVHAGRAGKAGQPEDDRQAVDVGQAGQAEGASGSGALELPEPGAPPAPPPAIGAAQRGPSGATGSPDDDPAP